MSKPLRHVPFPFSHTMKECLRRSTLVSVADVRAGLHDFGYTLGEIPPSMRNYIEVDLFHGSLGGWDCQLNAERTAWKCVPK